MDPITIGLLAGTGLGFLKGQGDIEAARAARQREAEIARWSPWTGIAPERVGQPSPMNSALQGALAGAQFGKQFGGGSAAQVSPDVTSTPGLPESPNGPYLTEEEYAQKIKPIGLPETTPENGWLDMTPQPPQPQYPLGMPTTQYPLQMQPIAMQSPWPSIYGPTR